MRYQSDTTILDRHGLRGKPFLLAVSSPNPNKNFTVVVRALERLGSTAPTCVVAGATDPRVFSTQFEPLSNMRMVGYLKDAELKALYEAATCFVFPSFYEGFGLPPLEAMACGCPVIASTAEAVTEVCDSAALYFDPVDDRELARLITSIFADNTKRDSLAKAGRLRASLFSWTHNASKNIEFIQEAFSLTT